MGGDDEYEGNRRVTLGFFFGGGATAVDPNFGDLCGVEPKICWNLNLEP